MRADLVSVLIPVRNGDKYVEDAIRSVLSSTYSELEVLIIDDGSIDNTYSIIVDISSADNRVKVFKNPSAGVSEALNFAISTANGRYLARMDADDIVDPYRFVKQIDYLKENKSIALVGGQIKYFGDKTGVSNYPLNFDACKAFLFFSPCAAHPTYMIDRTRFHISDLRYCPGDNMAQDFEFLCRNAEKYRYANLSDVVLHYRTHADQVTNKSLARMTRVLEFLPDYWRKNGFPITNEGLIQIIYPLSKYKVGRNSLLEGWWGVFNILISSRLLFSQKLIVTKMFFKNQIKGVVGFIASGGRGAEW